MIHIDKDTYNTLAQELVTAIVDKAQDEGVVEVSTKNGAEIIFAFNNVDYTLSRGISSMSYIILAFENGRRVSTDFNAQILDEKITF